VIGDFLLQIPVICIFHDNTEQIKGLIVERLLVGDNIVGLDRCEDSDFVEGVNFLFLLEFLDFNFLESVNLPIIDSLDFIYSAKRALAEFGKREKVFKLS
jgi:hypothetical protein